MAGERAGWRARLGTVRVRTTVAAVVVVGVALAVGAAVLAVALRSTLTDEVRTAAGLRATAVAGQLGAGVAPASAAVAEDDDEVVQVLGPGGEVVATSTGVDAGRPVADLGPGRSSAVDVVVEGERERFLVVARAAPAGGGSGTVLVGRALDDVADAVGAVTRLLLAGLPVLLLLVALTTWKLTGRALAPVEAIRAEVDAVSAAELHRRVPAPAGSDEIARLAATMNRMLDRLEEAQARQRRFVSDASHELRSPVATIRQHAEVALAHPGMVDAGSLAATVLAEDLRLQGIVEDLLLLARMDEGSPLRRRPVDVDDLVFEEAGRLRAAGRVQVDTGAVSAGRVDGDAAALRRVLRNLADNAGRHARSRVALSVAEAGGSVVVAVDDDGPGIPAGERDRVFQRFVRLDDARARDGGGTGLGLSIVAEVVAAHGGEVAVADSPLGGTRVEVRLPAGSA
jgi:signal transduction histidine kinase